MMLIYLQLNCVAVDHIQTRTYAECVCVCVCVCVITKCVTLLRSASSKLNSPFNAMEALQKFSKPWKVSDLFLISPSFLNTFDPTDAEIYSKI